MGGLMGTRALAVSHVTRESHLFKEALSSSQHQKALPYWKNHAHQHHRHHRRHQHRQHSILTNPTRIAMAPSMINGLNAIAKRIRSLILSRRPAATDDSIQGMLS
jgi:hypothetical protein